MEDTINVMTPETFISSDLQVFDRKLIEQVLKVTMLYVQTLALNIFMMSRDLLKEMKARHVTT